MILPQRGEGYSGTGSTKDPNYTLECDIESTDGHSFSWKIRTQDGVTADMWLDDHSYDLAQGNMFLVISQNGGIQVEQHQRDFSELDLTVEAISALSNSDPVIAEFIASIRAENDSSEIDNKDNLLAFVTSEYIIIDDQHGSGSSFGLSSDGERIAYLESGQPMIYSWGQSSEPIDFQALGLEYSSFSAPAWSPDGQLMAFHASECHAELNTVRYDIVQ